MNTSSNDDEMSTVHKLQPPQQCIDLRRVCDRSRSKPLAMIEALLARAPRIPILIWILFAIDVGLGVIYILDYLGGHSISGWVTMFIDLDREANLPTWYSSIQWFCVAAFFGIFAIRNFNVSRPRSWLLLALPLTFLGLSLDEVAQIHEKIGRLSDSLLPGGSRENILFTATGIWMFLLGVPFAVLCAALVVSIRAYFREMPRALVKLCLGMAITLIGATGIEIISNFVIPHSGYAALQVLAEELSELLGSTIVLWGAYEALTKCRFRFELDLIDMSGMETAMRGRSKNLPNGLEEIAQSSDRARLSV